jgi:hypothetical protein
VLLCGTSTAGVHSRAVADQRLRPPLPAVTHLLLRLGSAAVADPRVAALLFPLLQHATNLGAQRTCPAVRHACDGDCASIHVGLRASAQFTYTT